MSLDKTSDVPAQENAQSGSVSESYFHFRIPNAVRDALKEDAKVHHRSMTAQSLWILERYLAAPKALKKRLCSVSQP
jgi:hypothetical protein